MFRLRQAPRGIFSPLTAAETLELARVVGPPLLLPSYVPLPVQVAPDNLAMVGNPTRQEIQLMAGWSGPGYAGIPLAGNPPPSAAWWVISEAQDKYPRLVCERVNSEFGFHLRDVSATSRQSRGRMGCTDPLEIKSRKLVDGYATGFDGNFYNITPRMLQPYETPLARVPATQTSHVLMQVVDERFGFGTVHYSLVVISPKRKTIDFFG
ncbi:dc9ecaa9-414a-40a8-92b6-8749f9adf9a0 [Sclerotinia trifoliorum]|uniref:Dc9ecaa9-414a-40a8-92b6-8749f9adf9a0 n=1 Tax=Sclerotinia trifoliorum TaxID=28548 RepID=A0A8H2VU85_9HELO|nr:dc9ecaa9-414a-40a8-92b6-8749f9adf9a0 [Sclerotinia trifoliorum]